MSDLHSLLDNGQIVGIPMGTNKYIHLLQICFCFVVREISCCLFLTIIKLMLFTSRYLDDFLDIDNPYFEQMVSQIYMYLTELWLNKANSFDT